MKLLVIGGSGQAGRALNRIAESHGFSIVQPTHSELSIESESQLREAVYSVGPDWLINFSAFHELTACESDFERAIQINAAAVRSAAGIAQTYGCRFLTVSTDYVFDGKATEPYSEEAACRPLQAYGVSKLAGEMAALALAPEGTHIVRTCGLYGVQGSRQRGGNFIEKRIQEAKASEVLAVGGDLRSTPTSADAFAAGLAILLKHRETRPGTYHLTSSGHCSWAEFTEFAIRYLQLDVVVEHVDRKGDYGAIRRPRWSVLSCKKMNDLGFVPPSWQEDLSRFLDRIVPIE